MLCQTRLFGAAESTDSNWPLLPTRMMHLLPLYDWCSSAEKKSSAQRNWIDLSITNLNLPEVRKQQLKGKLQLCRVTKRFKNEAPGEEAKTQRACLEKHRTLSKSQLDKKNHCILKGFWFQQIWQHIKQEDWLAAGRFRSSGSNKPIRMECRGPMLGIKNDSWWARLAQLA